MSRPRCKVAWRLVLYIYLILSIISIPFHQTLAAEQNDWLKVIQTDTGYFINSATPNGNLSFRFEFSELKEPQRVAFVNNTGHYAIEYILPVELWEYEDSNENGYFDYTYSEWVSSLYGKVLNETVFAYYKNFWFSEISNVTTLSDDKGSVVCEWSIKGSAGLSYPWPEKEVLVPIKYTFHYSPLNGSLKTDFDTENFASKNETSRLFIEFSMRYTSEENESVEVLTDQEKLGVSSINDQHRLNSTTIFLTANGQVKGFFDFGGILKIDNSTTTPVGAVVPWIERGYQHFSPTYGFSAAVGIQLSYPHVNKTLTHDPSFGLKTSYEAPTANPSGGEPITLPNLYGEPPWKLPLIAGTIVFATITITTIIFLRRKRRIHSKLPHPFKS
jgi:hypothetical protein